jgi:hypothetical protein|tara:strand:+ start:572 stop:757 length:186 start_codon:yes stop_codon:yes gene_type:complete
MKFDVTYNLGNEADQNIFISVDEDGTLEVTTSDNKEMFRNELALAEEFGKKLLFKKEVSTG